ncbi:MAG: CubicO group peptidase (beta-lactamase class C family) [Saprospiraceae bacterium]|jgi:CubicO group peptidase (beta-lactamase class C family)
MFDFSSLFINIDAMKYLFLLCVFIFLLISCQQQKEENPQDSYTPEIVISDSFHAARIGEITFMSDYVSIDDYNDSHFIKSLDVPIDNSDNVNLTIRAYFDNSLTNYLRGLDTTRSISELVENGNYQFSFYVDDKKIYTEDLNVGAGSAASKNRNTSLCIPLYSKDKIDSWGRFMWSRFLMRNGGEEALSAGRHKLEIEIRPYLEIDKKIVGKIMAKGNIVINMVSDVIEMDEKMIAVQQIGPNTDWKVEPSLLSEKLIKELNSKVVINKFKEVTSISVLKDNKLIIEEYFNGANRKTLHDTRSVGKSITSTLIGIAIEKGYLKHIDQKISAFYDLRSFENYSEEKANITLRDLLTMTSVFDGSDGESNSMGAEDNIQQTKDWMRATLNLDVDRGKVNMRRWDYFTAGTLILGDILNAVTPKGLEVFANENLFSPLGISKYKWFHTPNGLPYGGGGLQLSSLSLLKIGSLYANNGFWKGELVLSKEWVKQSFSNQIVMPKNRGGAYGYLWYSDTFLSGDQSYEISYASGNGGNYIFIVDDLDLVIVITAQAYNTMEGAVQGRKMVEKYIIPSIINLK